jgi:hypothetical protein
MGTALSGVNLLGREDEHSPPLSTAIQDAWRCTSSPQYLFISWCLFKHKDSPTLFLVRDGRHSNGVYVGRWRIFFPSLRLLIITQNLPHSSSIIITKWWCCRPNWGCSDNGLTNTRLSVIYSIYTSSVSDTWHQWLRKPDRCAVYRRLAFTAFECWQIEMFKCYDLSKILMCRIYIKQTNKKANPKFRLQISILTADNDNSLAH